MNYELSGGRLNNYQVIDWQIVFDISRRYLDDFRVFAREVSTKL